MFYHGDDKDRVELVRSFSSKRKSSGIAAGNRWGVSSFVGRHAEQVMVPLNGIKYSFFDALEHTADAYGR